MSPSGRLDLAAEAQAACVPADRRGGRRAWPASTRAPVSVRRRPVVRCAGRPGGSRRSSGCGPSAILSIRAKHVLSPMYGRVSRAAARTKAVPASGAPSATAASTRRSVSDRPSRVAGYSRLSRSNASPRNRSSPSRTAAMAARPSGVGARKAAHARVASSSAAGVSRAHAFVCGSSAGRPGYGRIHRRERSWR